MVITRKSKNIITHLNKLTYNILWSIINYFLKKYKQSPFDEFNQNKIDSILDKISESGYDSLSKQEKEYLFKAGKKK